MSYLRTRYIISTVGYGIAAVLGVLAGIYFTYTHQWFIVAIAILFVGVAVDNFFCGDRCRVAGLPAQGHYTVPPFLKGKQGGKE